MIGSNNVRICKGVPTEVNFMGTDGTPIVIDVFSGVAYFIYDKIVRPIAGGTPIYPSAFNNDFSDAFANGS